MRTARQNTEGVIYHVISQFVDKRWYFTSDGEREHYLRLLGKALEHTDWLCFAYALMSSHIHLALIAGREPLESWAKRVNGPFAQWLNDTHDRKGPVFADRPADFAIPSHRELDLVAYIHNNPVRAKVVEHAVESTWTSHRAYVGAAPCPPWLHARSALSRMGLDAAQFDTQVRGAGSPRVSTEIETVRRALRQRNVVNVATPTIDDGIAVPLVARAFAMIRPNPSAVVRLVSEVVGVQLSSGRRSSALSRARRIAVHSASRAGVSGSDIAAALGISRQRASVIGSSTLDEADQCACARVLERLQIDRRQ